MAPPALLMDLYELTMLAGYFEQGMHERHAAFDLSFRELPFQGGYAVMAGLDPALAYLERLRFDDGDLDYLESLLLFKGAFLAYLSTLTMPLNPSAMVLDRITCVAPCTP